MKPIKTRKPYHSVIVMAPASGCEAARALKDKRILSTEAPRLPLGNCDRAERCRCIYKHVDDRRAGPRRESEHRGTTTKVPKQRRQGPGRRSTDE